MSAAALLAQNPNPMNAMPRVDVAIIAEGGIRKLPIRLG